MANPTIKEIARRCGVSWVTVSRVLKHGGAMHRPETRDLVLATASKLGYVPNASARAIRNGCFGAIALLLATDRLRNYLSSQLVDGVLDALAEHRLHLHVAKLPDQQLTGESVDPAILGELMVDGLLINYHQPIAPALVERIRNHRIPSVWLNTKQTHDCVHPDDLAAGHAATTHLLQLGHRRIAWLDHTNGRLGGDAVHYSAHDRRLGYTRAMRQAGLPVRTIQGDCHIPPAERLAFANAWLRSPDRPSAVVAYTQVEAVTTLEMAGRCGLRVPDDLSIITCSDGLLDGGAVEITSMLIPNTELAHVAVAMLRRRMKTPGTGCRAQAVPFQLAAGATCSPPTR